MRARARARECIVSYCPPAYPLSKTLECESSAQVGFLVLDVAAAAIVRYRPTHLHLLSKRFRSNGDYIIHVSLLRFATRCPRRYLDRHVVGSDSSDKRFDDGRDESS